jgi:hypothetical protein
MVLQGLIILFVAAEALFRDRFAARARARAAARA